MREQAQLERRDLERERKRPPRQRSSQAMLPTHSRGRWLCARVCASAGRASLSAVAGWQRIRHGGCKRVLLCCCCCCDVVWRRVQRLHSTDDDESSFCRRRCRCRCCCRKARQEAREATSCGCSWRSGRGRLAGGRLRREATQAQSCRRARAGRHRRVQEEARTEAGRERRAEEAQIKKQRTRRSRRCCR